MLRGAGRHQMRGGKFSVRPNLGAPDLRATATRNRTFSEEAAGGQTLMSQGAPPNTTTRMFAKPTGLRLDAGLVGNDPLEVISLAREMFDNDPIAGGVVEVIAGVPFGAYGLSGMPDKKLLEPYLTSMDNSRVKTLLPVLASTFMTDGSFLGTGIFDAEKNVYDAIVPQDVLHASITPVPFFGATPIIDVRISPEQARMLSNHKDPRMERYLKYLPKEFLRGGDIKLQPENTFYLPRRTLTHVPLGTSLFRKIMVAYILEKALARGTVEMAYRRQRPVLHIVAGDENWDPSQDDMQQLSDLFMAADMDPLGAVVVTRQGVQPQEVGGAMDMWKWTDNIDVLTSLKLKGLGMPDGLLGGDMALDSVSATLTVFINMVRSFRDYITRLLFYEKMFPYIAVTNDHKRDSIGAFQAAGRLSSRYGSNGYFSRASDLADVNIGDYLIPTVSWHNSMRPEGDKEYLDLLMTLSQNGVPIPLRVMAAAGGQDIQDIINSAEDDLEVRGKTSQYEAAIQGMAQAAGGGDQQQDQGGGYDEQGALTLENFHARTSPIKRKGLLGREYGDQYEPRIKQNGPARLYTTARERARLNEKANRTIAEASSNVHKRLRHLLASQEVDPHKPREVPAFAGVGGGFNPI